MPYLACGLVSLGLLFHFGIHLNGFLKRSRKTPGSEISRAESLRALYFSEV